MAGVTATTPLVAKSVRGSLVHLFHPMKTTVAQNLTPWCAVAGGCVWRVSVNARGELILQKFTLDDTASVATLTVKDPTTSMAYSEVLFLFCMF